MFPYLPSVDEMNSLLRREIQKRLKMKWNNEITVRSGRCKIGLKRLVSIKSKVVLTFFLVFNLDDDDWLSIYLEDMLALMSLYYAMACMIQCTRDT